VHTVAKWLYRYCELFFCLIPHVPFDDARLAVEIAQRAGGDGACESAGGVY